MDRLLRRESDEDSLAEELKDLLATDNSDDDEEEVEYERDDAEEALDDLADALLEYDEDARVLTQFSPKISKASTYCTKCQVSKIKLSMVIHCS